MKVSAWIGIFAVAGVFGLAACSSEDDTGGGSDAGTGGTGGSAGGGTGGSGATGGSAGASTGGTAGSSTGGTAGGGTGGSAGGTADCATCLQAECGSELTACTGNPDCLAILTCAQTCTDQACLDNCESSNPNGAADWGAVETCATTNCPQCVQ